MVPVQFVFNKFNLTVFGSYERELESDIDFISVYLDAIAVVFDNNEDNLIKEVCYVIEHEMWHYLLKDMNIKNEDLLIWKIMDYRTQGKIKDKLGEALSKKRKELERDINISYV